MNYSNEYDSFNLAIHNLYSRLGNISYIQRPKFKIYTAAKMVFTGARLLENQIKMYQNYLETNILGLFKIFRIN